ncbi:MAG TPA: hypothetical protein VLC93_14315, partial [Myxococcota bacterium]|nr:hypothetical protein [Myxococcota bacterium]
MRPHVIALSLFLAPTLAGAHGMRTAYFELTETAPGVLQAELKLPLADPNVTPVLPDGCDGALPPTDLTRSFVVRCDGSLRDRPIALRGLGPVVSDAVVRVAFADGSVASRVLTPERSAWVVPATARPDSRVAAA